MIVEILVPMGAAVLCVIGIACHSAMDRSARRTAEVAQRKRMDTTPKLRPLVVQD